MVPRGGIEPPTRGFSLCYSTNRLRLVASFQTGSAAWGMGWENGAVSRLDSKWLRLSFEYRKIPARPHAKDGRVDRGWGGHEGR